MREKRTISRAERGRLFAPTRSKFQSKDNYVRNYLLFVSPVLRRFATPDLKFASFARSEHSTDCYVVLINCNERTKLRSLSFDSFVIYSHNTVG